MKKCLVEIIFSLRRNNAMIGLILILCALCFGGGKILYSYIKTMELIEDKYEKTYTEQYIYQVVDRFDDEFTNYERPENYEKLAQWNEALHMSEVLSFVEISSQHLTEIKEKENIYYDTLYIGKNYLEEFAIEIETGRLFEEEDFIYTEGKCMPIIVGSSYAEKFKLGEKFFASTPFMQTEVCVVGFLKEGELLYYHEITKKADDYILFPMIDFPNRENIESVNTHLMYMKNCGIVKTGMTRNETQDYFYRLSDSLGMPGVFIIIKASNIRLSGMAISMQKIMQTSRTMLIVLCIITALLLIFYISRKMKRNWNYYSILYLLGFTRREVFGVMLGDMFLLLFVANLLAELVFAVWKIFTEAVSVGLWFNLVGSVVLLFVPFLFSVWGFKRKDLCSRITEENVYL